MPPPEVQSAAGSAPAGRLAALRGLARRRPILSAALLVGACTLGVRLCGLVKNQFIAWRFGTGPEMDAFNTAMMLLAWAISVLATFLPSAFLPTYALERARGGAAAGRALLSELL